MPQTERPQRPGGGSGGGSGKAQGAKRRGGTGVKPLGGVSAVEAGGLDYRDPNRSVGYDIEAGVSFVAADYFDGDEWAPQGWGPERMAELQLAMHKAGLLSDSVHIGEWLEESANAFKNVLEFANRTGVSWEDALGRMASSPTLKSLKGSGPTRAPFAARLSNPEDLREVFKQSAYGLLGGKGFIDDTQLDQMVSAYHQIETSSQRSAYDAAGAGGAATEAPRPDTFAEGQLEELDPEGVKAGRMASYVGALEGLLRNG